MKKAIIFDLDGTLLDTSKEIEQVWKDIAQNYKIALEENYEDERRRCQSLVGPHRDDIVFFASNLFCISFISRILWGKF